jgi:hypothetical protein
LWRQLDRINRQVNGFIVPISSFEHWGTMLDHWDYLVDGMGDCKIYALFKRKLLLDACFPRQALRPSSSFSTYRPPTDPSLILVKSPSGDAQGRSAAASFT